jgi:hypothetical protein
MENNDDLFDRKKKFIAMAHKRLDKLIDDLSEDLKEEIINEFADRLEKTGGKVDISTANLELIRSIDKVYSKFVKEKLQNLVIEIGTGSLAINSYNVDYFGQFDSNERQFKATVQKIKRIIRDRLGITQNKDGKSFTLKDGGYMDSMLQDPTVKNQIKNLSYREVLKGSGYQNLKKQLGELIAGNKEKMGAFQQHYSQYAYDIYVQIDRAEAKLYAESLGLVDFYYEGTIIETSRMFCVNHAGKLFNMDEAKKWKDLIGKYETVPGKKPGTTRKMPIGPIIPENDIPNYSPIDDMGGIRCRHIPRFISPEIAEKLRMQQSTAAGSDKK